MIQLPSEISPAAMPHVEVISDQMAERFRNLTDQQRWDLFREIHRYARYLVTKEVQETLPIWNEEQVKLIVSYRFLKGDVPMIWGSDYLKLRDQGLIPDFVIRPAC
ncbi:hypothetical protein [Lacunimicrobium album]